MNKSYIIISVVGIAILCVIISVWYQYYTWSYGMYQTDPKFGAGEFGDVFGAPSALFNGLAMCLALLAVIMQAVELSQQRREMKDTRHEFEINRATTALYKQFELIDSHFEGDEDTFISLESALAKLHTAVGEDVLKMDNGTEFPPFNPKVPHMRNGVIITDAFESDDIRTALENLKYFRGIFTAYISLFRVVDVTILNLSNPIISKSNKSVVYIHSIVLYNIPNSIRELFELWQEVHYDYMMEIHNANIGKVDTSSYILLYQLINAFDAFLGRCMNLEISMNNWERVVHQYEMN